MTSLLKKGDVVSVDPSEQRINLDNFKTGRRGFLLELTRLDHFDSRPAFSKKPPDSSLKKMESVHPVKRHNSPAGRHPTEFFEDGLPVPGQMKWTILWSIPR